MRKGYILSFVFGALFASGMIMFVMPDPAGTVTTYAVMDNGSNDTWSDNSSGVVITDTNYTWYLSEAFKEDNATIFSASCKPNAFIVNGTVTKYLCSLYYNDKIELRHISKTGSMWPNLIGGGYVIITEINSEDDLKVGDIIIINQTMFGTEVAHRITEKSYDGEGFYVITSGDNLKECDGTKIRFEQIVAKVVGIMY